jgi:Phosphorylase superfamily
MSTVPEVVAAHHCNMQILCLSLITNKVVMAGDEDEADHGAVANHEEVLEAVEKRAKDVQALVKKTVEIIGSDILPNLPPLPKVSLETPATKGQGEANNASSTGVVNYNRANNEALYIAGIMLLAAGTLFGMTIARQK